MLGHAALCLLLRMWTLTSAKGATGLELTGGCTAARRDLWSVCDHPTGRSELLKEMLASYLPAQGQMLQTVETEGTEAMDSGNFQSHAAYSPVTQGWPQQWYKQQIFQCSASGKAA